MKPTHFQYIQCNTIYIQFTPLYDIYVPSYIIRMFEVIYCSTYIISDDDKDDKAEPNGGKNKQPTDSMYSQPNGKST